MKKQKHWWDVLPARDIQPGNNRAVFESEPSGCRHHARNHCNVLSPTVLGAPRPLLTDCSTARGSHSMYMYGTNGRKKQRRRTYRVVAQVRFGVAGAWISLFQMDLNYKLLLTLSPYFIQHLLCLQHWSVQLLVPYDLWLPLALARLEHSQLSLYFSKRFLSAKQPLYSLGCYYWPYVRKL